MKFEATMTDAAFLRELGRRVAELRLARNMTQGQLAEQAGLGLRTVQRLELGVAATRLAGFLRVCRVLGLVERFEVLVPEVPVSPMAQLKLQGRKRQRARQRKADAEHGRYGANVGDGANVGGAGRIAEEPAKKWTWGEGT